MNIVMKLKTLQYIMGHSDIGVTWNTYTYFKFEDAQAEVLLMDESCRRENSNTTVFTTNKWKKYAKLSKNIPK